MKLNLSLDEINIIMTALGKAPYEAVFQLIENIRSQVQPQLQPSESE